jgi:ubiquinone/menaquinone biosynthesis C-methylase UbiE
MGQALIRRAPRGAFLARNPFPNGWTDGLFYREKMRAIHRIAPASISKDGHILEIGGGRSGLATMLYPDADVITLDLDPEHGFHQPAGSRTRFVCGDARALPFPDEHFDLVTLFDVLEHIEEHELAAAEALRVTRPGGHVLVSTPTADWHYPMYRFLKSYAPNERELMANWGHVRRGYTVPQLTRLFKSEPVATATFINKLTAFYHDIAFSHLGARKRKMMYAATAPLVLGAYAFHSRTTGGTETALAWRK